MKVRAYLDKIHLFDEGSISDVTFLKARARKDARTPFYHAEYQTTPIFHKWELKENMPILDYMVLNHKQAPIDWLSGAPWNNLVKRGSLICLLVISPEDFALLYPSAEQRESMEKFIDKQIEKDI